MRTPNYKCDVCGKDFYLRPITLSKFRTHCCSQECQNILRTKRMSGEGNHQFGLKGYLNSSYLADWKVTNYGYLALRVPNHPFRRHDDYILAHRLVVEEYLKQYDPGSEHLITVDGKVVLSPDVIVHHKDENKLNNSLNNLQIKTHEEHVSEHNLERDYVRKKDGTFASVSYKTTKEGSLKRAYRRDAGQDIFSSEGKTIYPDSCEVVGTSTCISVPEGYVGLVWSRSSLSVLHNIEVGAGCIDSGYTGELKVVLYNHGNTKYEVKCGDKIAQLLTIPVSLRDYEVTDSLEESERSSGSFGSTGA